MGDIKTEADLVYRDFVTDGVPSTGDRDPQKPEIRALFTTVDTKVETIVAGNGQGLLTFATTSARTAFVHSGGTTGVTGQDLENDNVYYSNGSAWVLIGPSPAADLVTAQGDIDALETRMDDAEDDLGDLAAADTALDGRLDTAETTISSHTSSLATLASADTALDGRLDTAETTIASHTSSIATLVSADTALDGRLDTAETTIASHTASLATLTSADTTLDARLDAAEPTIASHTSSLATLASADTALDTRVDVLEGQQAAMDVRLSGVETIGAEGRLTTLEAATVTEDARLDALEAHDAGDRLTAVEAVDATQTARLTVLEAIDAGDRLQAIEALNPGARLTNLEAADTAFADELADLEAGALADAGTAEVALLWSPIVVGEPQGRAAIADGDIAVSALDGRVVRIEGAAVRAPRASYRLLPGHKYEVLAAARRSVDPADPSGDAVSLKAAWLYGNKTLLSAVSLEDEDLFVAGGMHIYRKVVSLASGTGVDTVAPAGAVYITPYLQTFGSDGVTDIIPLVRIVDLTANTLVSADLAGFETRLAALESLDLGGSIEDFENYTAPWTGAVERPKASRLADALHLDDFAGGSVNFYNGTTDTTTAFRAAIAAAEDSGRTLKVPRGAIYKITDEIDVPDGVRIEFGAGVTIRQATANRAAFLVSGDDVTIEGNGVLIECTATRTDPGLTWLGYGGHTRGSALYLTGNNPTIRDVQGKNFFATVHLRGPVVAQVLSSTGYDHSANGQGLRLENISADTSDCVVTGGQYQDAFIRGLVLTNPTTTSGSTRIIRTAAPLNASQTYGMVAKRIDIRDIHSSGYAGVCMSLGSCEDLVIDDCAISACPEAIRLSWCTRSVIGQNVRITEIPAGGLGIVYRDGGSDNRQANALYAGAEDAWFTAVRAQDTGVDVFVEAPRVITNFEETDDVGTDHLFKSANFASMTVSYAKLKHLQANDMFAFGTAGTSDIKVLWPRNAGNSNGKLLRVAAGTTALLRAYPGDLDGFDEDDDDFITESGTLVKDFVYPWDQPRFGTYVVPRNEAGFGATFQGMLQASIAAAVPVMLGEGTVLADSQSMIGSPDPTGLLGSTNENDGAGTHVAIWGVGADKSIVRAGTNSEFFLRYEGLASNPIDVDLRDFSMWSYDPSVTEDVLDYWAGEDVLGTTQRPQLFLQNARLNIVGLEIVGRPDLASGAGIGGTGYFTGWIVRAKTRYSAGVGINFGVSAGNGGFFEPGNHPIDLHFLGDEHTDGKSHFRNVHMGERISFIGGHYSHRTDLHGYTNTNGGVRFGNGGMELIFLGFIDGAWRDVQADDYKHVIIGGILKRAGGPAIVCDHKDSGESAAMDFSDAMIIDAGQGRGHPNPNEVEDDEDFSVSNEEFAGALIRGGDGHVSPRRPVRNQVKAIWQGFVIAEKDNPLITIGDNDFRGNNFAAMSKCTGGDGVFLGPLKTWLQNRHLYRKELQRNRNKPDVLGFVTTVDQEGWGTGAGGIGPRKFYTGRNGSGDLITSVAFPTGEIPWKVDAPEGFIVEGGSCVQQVMLDGGALHDVGDIDDLGNAGATFQAGEHYRILQLREHFVQVGYSAAAPSGLVANTWRSYLLPNYLRLGPGTEEMSCDTADKTVTVTGMNLLTTIKPHLDDGLPVNLFSYQGGRKKFVGKVESVTGSSTLELTENARHDAEDELLGFGLDVTTAYGITLGDPSRNKDGLPQLGFDHWWNHQHDVIGWGLAPYHIYIETVHPLSFPVEKFRIPAGAYSNTTGVIVDAILPRYGWRQRIAYPEIRFTSAIGGDSGNHIVVELLRQRGTDIDVIADSGPVHGTAAGALIAIEPPMPDNDALAETAIIEPDEQGDIYGVRIRAVGTGVTIAGIGTGNLPIAGW